MTDPQWTPERIADRLAVGLDVPRELLDPPRPHACASCGRPSSPYHDAGAPGPTVRHPYVDAVQIPMGDGVMLLPVELLAELQPADEPVEGEVLTSEPDPHAITRTPHSWGVAWTCACGRWEGVATGPSSAAWCERNYAQHRREEEAAARGE